jgi:hypothetical protein
MSGRVVGRTLKRRPAAKSVVLKRLLVNLLVLLLTVVICLLAFEAWLRFFFPQLLNPKTIYMDPGYVIRAPHAEVRWVDSWHGEFDMTTAMNSQGFIDRDYEIINHSQRRIVVLGDSFIEGGTAQFEHTHHYLLEQKLKLIDQRYVVLNAGRGGAGTSNEYLYLKNDFLKYKPEMVILYMYHNDLDDNYFRNAFSIINGTLVRKPITEYSLITKFRIYMSERSQVYSFIAFTTTHTGLVERFLQRIGVHEESAYKQKYTSDIPFVSILRKNETSYLESLNETFPILQEMRNLVTENNATFVIVYIPSIEYQLDDARFARQQQKYGTNFSASDLDKLKFNRDLSAFCDRENIPLIDLTPFFAQNDPPSLYFPIDPHWNDNGQALSATYVYEQLVDRHLLT